MTSDLARAVALMQVLVLHPDDDFDGSWGKQRFDTVVDLGRAPKAFYEARSAELGCPVFSIFDLAVEVEDLWSLRKLLEIGLGRVVDGFGIDWWDVIGLQLHPELQNIQLAIRLADKLKGSRTLVATRTSVTLEALRLQLDIRLRLIPQGLPQRFRKSLVRRAVAVRDLGFVQSRQVIYDKYDPHYFWRRKLSAARARPTSSSKPVILLPSAYSNVTKTALSYARLLPQQRFLLVLARESGAVSPLPENVDAAYLSGFSAKSYDAAELRRLQDSWKRMEDSLKDYPEYELALQTGVLQKGLRWLRWGMAVRDAWLQVFNSFPIAACLSADDSNPYTRIPLLLAEHFKVAAVACHHGALDFRMAFKNLRFTRYLAKGEMEVDYLKQICGVDGERIRTGAPVPEARESALLWRDTAPWITYFAEPYETDFWRVEAIYREVLPRLCAVARRVSRTVVLKLHPFESARQRLRLVTRILNASDRKLVTVMKAPLSREILEKTWCAITVESTVAFECATIGIPSFLCGWLRNAYSGYAPQYVRFGVGRMLESADDLLCVPELLTKAIPDSNIESKIAARLIQAMSPKGLSQILLQSAASGKQPRDAETGAAAPQSPND